MKSMFTRLVIGLARDPTREWRHHRAGMLQSYLAPDWRVHIHHPDLKTADMAERGDVHDHNFGFQSLVLMGQLRHSVFLERRDAEGPLEMYEICGEGGPKRGATFRHTGARYATDVETIKISAGQSYEFRPQQFHRTMTEGLAITLLWKTARTTALPRLLVPLGLTPAHAFAADLSERQTRQIVAMACDALEHA